MTTKEGFLKINLANEHARGSLGSLAKHLDKRTPFELYAFQKLLDKELFDQLRKDVSANVELSLKSNDLYKFKQSKDLKCETEPADKLGPLINSFCDAMLRTVRPRLEELSGLKLSSEKFDITASRYDPGNYLLCHNDDIKDPTRQRARALAFIFYLNTRPWTSDDGGALVLYDSDENGEPIEVNNYLFPVPNNLVVFKTSATSWHSVQEVTCKNDVRLSINGWFHLAEPPEASESTAKQTIEPSPFTFLRPTPLDDRLERFFKECINGDYLMEKTCLLIRRQFKSQSEINIPKFLVPEKYQEISKALREAAASARDSGDCDGRNLQQVGPYNKRNYLRFKIDKLPQICRDLHDALRSELFFVLLSRFTGLDLQPPHLAADKQEGEYSSSSDEEDDDDEDETGEEDSDSEGEASEDDGEAEDDGEEDKDENLKEESEPAVDEATKESNDHDEPSKSEKQSRKRKLSKTCDPLARLEFRHLDVGSYTLIHDHNFELGERSALDVVLHFNHDFEVNFEHGGFLSYIEISGDENEPSSADSELLTVDPKSNSLSLVYRGDGSTARFLQHITHEHQSSFQDLSCVYYESPEDLPGGGSSVHIEGTSETAASKRSKLEGQG